MKWAPSFIDGSLQKYFSFVLDSFSLVLPWVPEFDQRRLENAAQSCGIPLPFGIMLDCEELKGLTNPVAPTPEYVCYFFLVNNHFIAKGQLVYEGKQY